MAERLDEIGIRDVNLVRIPAGKGKVSSLVIE